MALNIFYQLDQGNDKVRKAFLLGLFVNFLIYHCNFQLILLIEYLIEVMDNQCQVSHPLLNQSSTILVLHIKDIFLRSNRTHNQDQ